VDAVVHASSQLCRVLEHDPELAEAIPAARREQAVRECLSRTLTLPAGRWLTPGTSTSQDGIGMLVIDGLLLRRVGLDGRFGAELLGAGDLLRPWQGADAALGVTGWRVIEPAHLAVLDERFARRLARYPEVTGSLVGRAVERSRHLVVNMAIVHQPRVDVRLHMLFWHLAARWGKVRSSCVSLPLPLTHSVLADLTAARRPTVTSALSALDRSDRVHPAPEGWHLLGRPPGELLELVEMPAELADPGDTSLLAPDGASSDHG
jgi:CRP/FNR family transcriptional regulator, cyclic AMP receptor protein